MRLKGQDRCATHWKHLESLCSYPNPNHNPDPTISFTLSRSLIESTLRASAAALASFSLMPSTTPTYMAVYVRRIAAYLLRHIAACLLRHMAAYLLILKHMAAWVRCMDRTTYPWQCPGISDDHIWA